MGKIDNKKKQKMDNLLNTAFELFTSQGLYKTSISDIVQKAGVAKGTFYLYFKDKYDIRNRIISHQASLLFENAYNELQNENIVQFEDRLLFITNHILDSLNNNKTLMQFMYKDLSWGVFKKALLTQTGNDDVDFAKIYQKMIDESGVKFSNPEVMLFLIIELVGSTGYSSIMYSDPVSLEELKPCLDMSIRNIIKQFTIS
ncbi:MAG: TetR/AcrR family transcriptional regulator [Butyrivibrio sp.]|nr:TetR/AcrR family transcriptional regulator [Butyrivibrio sp.]